MLLLIAIGSTVPLEADSLQHTCLSCHQAQQIPSEMIYRRYLMRYASKETIKKKMAVYLKHPTTDTSIMPAPFFRKFPLKKATTLEDTRLERLIEAYIAHYDVDGKIVIQSSGFSKNTIKYPSKK